MYGSFPNAAFKTAPKFVLLRQGRSSRASSSHASVLQVIADVVSLALCAQVVFQAPQHFRSSEKQATCEGCFACQSICSVIFLHSGMSAAVHPQGFLKVHVNHWHISVWASYSQQHSSSVYCWCLRLFRLQPYWSIRQNGQRCQRVLALHALLTVAILERLTLQRFWLNIWVWVFCFMFAWGMVLWIDLRKGLYNIWEEF